MVDASDETIGQENGVSISFWGPSLRNKSLRKVRLYGCRKTTRKRREIDSLKNEIPTNALHPRILYRPKTDTAIPRGALIALSIIIRAPISESRSLDMWLLICPTLGGKENKESQATRRRRERERDQTHRFPPALAGSPSAPSFLAVGSSRSWIRRATKERKARGRTRQRTRFDEEKRVRNLTVLEQDLSEDRFSSAHESSADIDQDV